MQTSFIILCSVTQTIHTYIHILFNNAGLKMAAEADVDLLTIDDWNLSL